MFYPLTFIRNQNFLPNAGYYGRALPENPNYTALNKLEGIFKKMEFSSDNKQYNNQNDLKASVWKDQHISFYGQGPIIINAAYFPDWRSKNFSQEVYQVTPGQMLVFAQGNTNLEFSASDQEKVSGWISVVAIILLISSGVFLWKKSKN